MQRLGNAAPLVPSSMNGGNTTSGDPALAMTAPGSPGVIPTPETLDRLPLPVASGEQIPVSNQQHRTEGNPAPGGDGGWNQITETGNGGWKHL